MKPGVLHVVGSTTELQPQSLDRLVKEYKHTGAALRNWTKTQKRNENWLGRREANTAKQMSAEKDCMKNCSNNPQCAWKKH